MERHVEQKSRRLHLGVQGKILLPIVCLGVLLTLGAGWYIVHYSSTQAVQARFGRAQTLADQMLALRRYYTANVVSRVKEHGITVTHDYTEKPAAIPLPATMVHELNKLLSEQDEYTIRLYSQHPFPFRKDGGPRDAFEHEAIRALQTDPEKPFWRLEELNGVPTLRYAVADRMIAEACINCHNAHPDSPRKDWKLGDVRGALELMIPVGQALAAARTGALRVAGAIGLGVLAILVIGGWNVHRLLTPVRKMTEAASKIAHGDLNQQITHTSADEIGVLARALNTMAANLRHIVFPLEMWIQ
jgi:HAMP domain-containing protein